ncbi:MAG: hypothetical protein Q8K70_04855 [Bacteroidota bacterium]|nr:hypothetical protein [Bacteroidota bacterium]
MEDNQINPPKRPTFLTVLCILTFIGSAFSIFSGVSNAMLAPTSAAMLGPITLEVEKEFEKAKQENKVDLIEDMNEQATIDSLTGGSIDSNDVVEAIESSSSKIEEEMIGKIQNTVGGALASVTEETIRNSAYASIIAAILTLMGAFFMWGLKKIGFWVYVLGTAVSIIAPIIIYNGNVVGAFTAIGLGFVGLIFVILYAVNRKHLVY